MENSHNKGTPIPVAVAILCTLVPVPFSTLLNFTIIRNLKQQTPSMISKGQRFTQSLVKFGE
jgi:hypothetical protein